ncbi:hypothetical protein JCGZ_25957 [Jatropha curcas]|uniref:Uncharacterized protein n=1 Tax=Jatropha curcas TaxID=180498 RepID=A0A067JE35_JATCU|nr:protein SPT2 homolog [Jatropha curcas]KDP22126.1 hypothetical protein JCGZ_25957 [Jatropha curcas]
MKTEVERKDQKEDAQGKQLFSIQIPTGKKHYGSSHTLISERVIKEGKASSNLESKDLGYKDKRSDQAAKIPRLKESRDYSFLLSDETETPTAPPSGNGCHSKNSNGKPKLASMTSKERLCNNLHSESPANNRNLERKKPPDNKPRIGPKQTVQKQNAALQDGRRQPKKRTDRHDNEGQKAIMMVKEVFNTKRFIGRDDADIVMETNFEEINNEEKRSERLGREEDKEQLRLIEEEAVRERTRKLKRQRTQSTVAVI